MAGTFLCPRACGFVKVATIEIARKARSEARKRGDVSIAIPRSYSRRAVQTVRGNFQGFGKTNPQLQRLC